MILPNLGYSANELLPGLVINTRETPLSEAVAEPSHSSQQKMAFNQRVCTKAPGEVTFCAGDLVQVYRSDLDFTVSTAWKLEPRWSAPR